MSKTKDPCQTLLNEHPISGNALLSLLLKTLSAPEAYTSFKRVIAAACQDQILLPMLEVGVNLLGY